MKKHYFLKSLFLAATWLAGSLGGQLWADGLSPVGDLSNFVAGNAVYTLKMQGTVGTPITVAGSLGSVSYTPVSDTEVTFVRYNNVVYVYESTAYKGTATETPFTFPEITKENVLTSEAQLLGDVEFDQHGASIATDKYGFGDIWKSNVTPAPFGIRVGVSGGNKVLVWRGSGNSNYISQPLSGLLPNTAYKVQLRQVTSGNANADFNVGFGTAVGGIDLAATTVRLGTGQDGDKVVYVTTPASLPETVYFTFRNTATNTASSGSDPVAQLDFISLVATTNSVRGISGVSSASYANGEIVAPGASETLALNSSYVYAGKTYTVKSANLFENGSFNDGVSTYTANGGYTTAALLPNFTWHADGGVSSSPYLTVSGAGGADARTIRHRVAVEKGKEYLFVAYTSGQTPDAANYNYNALFQVNDEGTTESGLLKALVWGADAGQTATEWAKTEHVFTASTNYVAIRLGWNTNVSVDEFQIYEVEKPYEISEAYTTLQAQFAVIQADTYQYASDDKKTAFTSAVAATPTSNIEEINFTAALTDTYRAVMESHAKAEGVVGAKDMTSAIVNPVGDNLTGWTNPVLSTASNEPWTSADGSTAHSYFDTGSAWGQNAWEYDMNQTLTLPTGKYLISVMERAAPEVTTYQLYAGDATKELTKVGNAGNYFNRGWDLAVLEFEVANAGEVKIGVKLATATVHTWASFGDFRLVKIENGAAVLDETNPLVIPQEAKSVTLKRSLAKGWNSLVVPFALGTEKLAELGLEAYEYNGTVAEGGNLLAKFTKATSMDANKPYVVKASSPIENITLGATTIEAANALTVSDSNSNYDLVGLYTVNAQGETSPIKEGDYIVIADGIKRTQGGNGIKAFRAFLQKKEASGARQLVLSMDGETVTGIEALEIERALTESYDLNGRRVGQDAKGILIVNGKKVVK